MKTVSATEAKNHFGDHLDFGNDESLLIESNGSPSHMAFTYATGRRLVLVAFSAGEISRYEAMEFLVARARRIQDRTPGCRHGRASTGCARTRDAAPQRDHRMSEIESNRCRAARLRTADLARR